MSKNLTREYFDGRLDEASSEKIYTSEERDYEPESQHIVRPARRLRRNDDEVGEAEEQRKLAGTVSNSRS